MIKSLRILDPEATAITWWKNIPAFQGKTEFQFNPEGLTVVWGPNGSGKSSLLRLMARALHCEQGGIPMVTPTSLREIKDALKGKPYGIELRTDGQPVHYFDPTSRPGLFGGMAAFDGDFMGDAMATIGLDRVSSGQQTDGGLARILRSSVEATGVTWKQRPSEVAPHIVACMQTSEEKGKRTILLDEPERSRDLPAAAEFWGLLRRQPRFQIIVATHSVFALNIPDATYIDVQEGYLAKCRALLNATFTTSTP